MTLEAMRGLLSAVLMILSTVGAEECDTLTAEENARLEKSFELLESLHRAIDGRVAH